MADAPHKPEPPDIPEAAVEPRSRRPIQLVWLIPLVAALVGGWLAVKAILEKGPVITITFNTAEGLEAGKTKIKYKDVEVGLVKSVTLTSDAKRVVATAELAKDAAPYLVDDTRFWVVRARISGGTVSGLGTLLSGSYIGADIGKSAKPRRDFVGLEEPPIITTDVPGRQFVLHSSDLGSLDVGEPVYFRRLQAGQIASYELDKDGKGVTLKIFIDAPYDRFVTANTRFWHASGIDVSLDSSGINVRTQSIVSILIGGIAFETPLESADQPPAAANTEYTLFANRTVALKNPETLVEKMVMVFNESVRGLAVGAPVDFRGIDIGNVSGIKVEINPADQHINIVVEADMYPERLRERYVQKRARLSEGGRRAMIETMIARGLRAQLRTGNLLTGQLYVALDFYRNAPKAKLRSIGNAVEVPTTQSSMRQLQETISNIAAKIDALPLAEIGADLRQTLQSANKLMVRLDNELMPEARGALLDARKALESIDHILKSDSPLQTDTREAMREIARAAEAFRVLADYLERHPEALISGKKPDTGSQDGGKKEDKK